MSLVVVILMTIAGIVVPSFHDATESAKVAQAVTEISILQSEIMAADTLPETLADIGRGNFLDPWGNPYQYLNFATATRGHGNAPPAGARKDRFLVPINSTFDLYSMGADGTSQAALTAHASRDDVVRAGDGAFIGLARNF